MGFSADDLKGLAEIVRNLVESIGLVVGGFWAYLKFIKKREHCPCAEIGHSLERYTLTGDKNLVHLDVRFKNCGETLLSLSRLEVRLQQILPLTDYSEALLSNASPVPSGRSEITWPLVDIREVHWDKGQAELEPGEAENIHADFIVDAGIKLIEAYSFIENTFKGDRRIGWGYTSIHEL